MKPRRLDDGWWSVLRTVVLFACLIAPHAALALDASVIKQIKNIARPIGSAIDAKDSPGASSALQEILTNSDTIGCSALLINGRIIHNQLIQEQLSSSDPDRVAEIDQALIASRRLQDIIGRSCDKITNPDAYRWSNDADPPEEAAIPVFECNAECQARLDAYFAALQDVIDTKLRCTTIYGRMRGGEALPLAIAQLGQDLDRSIARRDSAKRLYDARRQWDDLVDWNNFREEVDQTQKRIDDLEDALARIDADDLQSDLDDCQSDLRAAEAAKEAAYKAFVSESEVDPQFGLNGVWVKPGTGDISQSRILCREGIEGAFVCHFIEPLSDSLKDHGFELGDVSMRGQRFGSEIVGTTYTSWPLEWQEHCPSIAGHHANEIMDGRINMEFGEIRFQRENRIAYRSDCRIEVDGVHTNILKRIER